MDTLGVVFDHSTDAVFGIDRENRIRYTNRAFDRLMGYSGAQLCGKWCAEVLCGTDMQGQRFCGDQCPIPKTLTDAHPVNDFDLVVRHAEGKKVLVNIGACYITPGLQQHTGQVRVFFNLREANPHRLLQRVAMMRREESDRPARTRLTPREREVLTLAARGLGTAQIASRLSVSRQTVCTHFKNIYPKLGVHSRSEAVIHALRYGLH